MSIPTLTLTPVRALPCSRPSTRNKECIVSYNRQSPLIIKIGFLRDAVNSRPTQARYKVFVCKVFKTVVTPITLR